MVKVTFQYLISDLYPEDEDEDEKLYIFVIWPKETTGVDAVLPKIVKAAAQIISRHIANIANGMQA